LGKASVVVELSQTLAQLVAVLGKLIIELLALALHGALLIFWLAWSLWGINWKKVWPVLAQGAWAPGVLIVVLAALAWSRLVPSDCGCLGFMTVPNFWWQLGAVGLIVAVTLFCGWLQGVFHWEPAEINLEPPAPAAVDHGHHH
jgi:hypothetical protein